MHFEEHADGRISFHSDYRSDLVELCRSVPGMTWSKPLMAWVGYADAAECVRDGLPEPCLTFPFQREDETLLWRAHCGGLRPFQVEGVEFLLEHAAEGVLLCDQMGAGKTAQAIHAALEFNAADGGRTVVVCPSFVRGVWVRELAKWWPGVNVDVREGVTKVGAVRESADVVVCHYDILHAHLPAIREWVGGSGVTLVLDEAHFLASEKSRRSKACKELAKMAKFRVGLTGTPLTNRPRDLWNVVDTLCPGRFGNFFKFALAFCDAKQKTVGRGADAKTVWDFSGKSNLDVLRKRLAHFMLRRTYADIALQLPPKTRQIIELKVPVKSRVQVVGSTDARAMRRALDVAADAKLPETLALIRQHAEDGHKVVVFCHRRAVAEMVATECGGLYIHGGVTQPKRDERIAACSAAEGPAVLAATIDVASVGIDLTFADVCVFAELTWEPWELEQAEARLYRQGQQKPVLIQYVIALGTGEEFIRDGVVSKLGTVDAVLGEKSALRDDLKGTSAEDALRELWEGLAVEALDVMEAET